MRSLFSKLFLASLLVLAVALLIFSLLLSSAFESLYLRLGQAQLVARARKVAAELGPVVARGASQQELQALVHIAGASTTTEICLSLRSAGSESMVGTGPSGGGEEGLGPGAAEAETGVATIVSHSVTACGEDILLAMAELPDGLGTLYMRAPVSDVVGKYVEQLRRLVLYAGSVAVVISLLVALLLAERISGPLRSMRTLAARMADGDFSQRVRISTPDEIGALGRSFDSLADSLEGTLARLSGERARLRGILASVTEGIIAVDAEGKVALINPQAAELLKLDPHESMGKSISGLTVPTGASSTFRDCLAANELRSADMEVDQPRRYLTLHVAPVRAEQEGEWGAVGVLRDVSEARRLDQMRSRFISDASHEIRTPLTAIGGFATAIADGTAATDEERTRGATLIVREVQRLNRLTNDLLDLSRIESGAAPLDLQPVSVREVIEGVVDSLETQIRESELSVELDLPRDLPQVWAGPDRLYQVLLNLVSNAIHFNSPRGRITLAARVTGSQVRVDVSDTGTGIPADELPHIWERFRRADVARTREAGGTGLGLAIVRSIVTAHGGEVSADSVLGEGTTLTFTVPVHSSTTPVES